VSEEPVHEFFGLSYSNYLVLPRVVMQSMPIEWQRDMVELLEEAGAKFGGHYQDKNYIVELQVGHNHIAIDDLADYERGRRRLEPCPGGIG
jgi:hypothetical protein